MRSWKAGHILLIVTVHECPSPPPSGCREVIMRKIGGTFGFCPVFKLILSHIDVGKWPLLPN